MKLWNQSVSINLLMGGAKFSCIVYGFRNSGI